MESVAFLLGLTWPIYFNLVNNQSIPLSKKLIIQWRNNLCGLFCLSVTLHAIGCQNHYMTMSKAGTPLIHETNDDLDYRKKRGMPL